MVPQGAQRPGTCMQHGKTQISYKQVVEHPLHYVPTRGRGPVLQPKSPPSSSIQPPRGSLTPIFMTGPLFPCVHPLHALPFCSP